MASPRRLAIATYECEPVGGVAAEVCVEVRYEAGGLDWFRGHNTLRPRGYRVAAQPQTRAPDGLIKYVPTDGVSHVLEVVTRYSESRLKHWQDMCTKDAWGDVQEVVKMALEASGYKLTEKAHKELWK